MKWINAQRTIGIFIVLILVGMTICPAIESSAATAVKTESHCHEQAPPAPQKNEKMLCCCDQNAIAVSVLHAPFVCATMLLNINSMSDPAASDLTPLILSHYTPRDHLVELSVLRL